MPHKKGMQKSARSVGKGMQSRFETKKMVLAALFTAVMAVTSQIQIPVEPVPFNLAVLGVFLTGMLLPPAWAVISVALYILLGGIGVPVFAGFTGGPAILFGATGGYIAGYLFLALATSLGARSRKIWVTALAMTLGLAITYAFGTAWYMIFSGVNLDTALHFCVLPFVPFDIGKGVLACAAGRAVQDRLAKARLL